MNEPVIMPIENGTPFNYYFHCPGCNSEHGINTNAANGRPLWILSGPPEQPTISPSILVRGGYYDQVARVDKVGVCHSFVRNGQIQFLTDCTHHLAGQTVPLPAL
ncbi:DUF6527 family protein [Hymenobacter sp. 102]|uniref:DUF6527 family protein n=1 Tax=Hymenobacter sp. 102 TaxID=3403152 RepID=UPI003CEC1DC0